jgi:hypothetical protein
VATYSTGEPEPEDAGTWDREVEYYIICTYFNLHLVVMVRDHVLRPAIVAWPAGYMIFDS